MPLVQIDVLEGWAEKDLELLGSSVQDAMVTTLSVPVRDHFQILEERSHGSLRFNRDYLDRNRSERFVLVRVTLSAGRTTEAKRAFYAQLYALLDERLSLRPDDLTVILVENQREDWSFAAGRASYLELPRDAWR